MTQKTYAVPEGNHYDNITNHLRYLNDKIVDAFNQFITLTTAIVGGAIYLETTLDAADARRNGLRYSAIALLVVVGIASAVLMWANDKSWHAYREKLSQLFPEIDPPKKVTRKTAERLMYLLIVVTCLGFIFANPLVSPKPASTSPSSNQPTAAP